MPVISLGSVKLRGKYSTPILLYCWRQFMENEINIYEPKIDVLRPLACPLEQMNCNRNKVDMGYIGGEEGVFRDSMTTNYPDAASFVPQEWLFSTFLRDVVTGDIDCDTLPIIKNNVKKPYDEAIKLAKETAKKLTRADGKRTPSPRKTTTKKRNLETKEKSIIPPYVNNLATAFNFTTTGTAKQTKKDLPPVTKEQLSETFKYYLDLDAVQKVIFRCDKVKLMHESGNQPPETGAAGMLYNQLLEKEEQKKAKKRKKERQKLSYCDPGMYLY